MIDIETARAYYSDRDSAHGFDHVLRVLGLAERIGREEGADLAIVHAAALLHDVARVDEQRTGVCHAQVGAQRAREILKDHPSVRVERVAQAIAEHRFRAACQPTSLEAQVLWDADKLDAMGAIGVARAYAVAGQNGQHLWAAVSQVYAERTPSAGHDDLRSGEHTPVHEYIFKLVRLRELVMTQTGRRLAEGRHAYLVAFFERLRQEMAGEV